MRRPAEPKLEYLIRTNPEILQQEQVFMNGEEVTFGKPNDQILFRRVREHGERGREALKDFTRWLIRHEGYAEAAARLSTAYVWDALCITWTPQHGSEPWKVLDDTRYGYGTRLAFMGALRRWASFAQDADLANQLLARKGNYGGKKKASRVLTPAKPQARAYKEKEINALLQAIDQVHRDPRWPWAYPIMRIIALTGVSLSGLLQVTREQAKVALSNPMLACWSRSRHGPQAIPSSLIREELKMLIELPWDWGMVVDVVEPIRKNVVAATRRIVEVANLIYEVAGIPRENTWIPRLRWTCAVRYYRATKNIVGVQQIVGPKTSFSAIKARLGI